MTKRRRRKRKPEDSVAKLGYAHVVLNADEGLAVVPQSLEVSKATPGQLAKVFDVFELRAGNVLCLPLSIQRLKSWPGEDEGPLAMRLLEVVRSPRFGADLKGGLRRWEGWWAGQSRVFLFCQREVLEVPEKPAEKETLRERPRLVGIDDVVRARTTWCLDSAFDRTAIGCPLQGLSIVDECAKKWLALLVDRGVTSEDVIDTLPKLFAVRGVPNHIRIGRGPEFIAGALRHRLGHVGVGRSASSRVVHGRRATPRTFSAQSGASFLRSRSSTAFAMPRPPGAESPAGHPD